MLKMKINKLEIFEETLTVWTDQFDDVGFNFEIAKIQGKDDLKKQIKERIKAELKIRNQKKELKNKFKDFEELVGKEI